LLLLLLLLLWRARQALSIWDDKEVPKRWGITPDTECGGIRLSLVVVDSHLLTGAPLKGVCHCPQLTYCRPLSNNRCWRRCRQTVMLQSVLRLCSGFYRSKDPTNSIKVLKEVQSVLESFCQVSSGWLVAKFSLASCCSQLPLSLLAKYTNLNSAIKLCFGLLDFFRELWFAVHVMLCY